LSRRPPRRLRWFVLGDGEDAWTVYLVDRVNEDGLECVGVTRYETHTIDVVAWQSYDEILHTTLHELLHAWSGEDPDDEVARLAEERFIRRCERAAFDGLTSMGMRLPDLPRGFDALRARAIAAQEGHG
jgi:hypothetical protein